MVRWIASGTSVRTAACGQVRSVVRRVRCGNDIELAEADVRPCAVRSACGRQLRRIATSGQRFSPAHPTLIPVQAGASLAGKLSSEASSTLS
jgi:hypothetical protein